MKTHIIVLGLCAVLLNSCGVYTFRNTSLPQHIKSIQLPLFLNQSLEPTVAEDVTQELNRRFLRDNIVRVVTENGDGIINGTISAYSNNPYTYSSPGDRQVNVNQYAVRITADVEFLDITKNEPIFKGAVTGEGIYNFQTENEQIGRTRAVSDLVKRIFQNSLQSW